MMLFRDRIQSAFTDENSRRKESGEPRLTKTDLWKAADVTSASATFWFNGDNGADLDTCMKIAPLLQVSGQWLFDGTGPKGITELGQDDGDHAPIHMVDAKASAGKGRIVYSSDETKILMFRRDYLAKNDAKPGDVLAFEVDGDSMIDMHIPHGAVVLANRKKTDPIAKQAYVVWIGGELYVKQLIQKDGLWYARSRNAAKENDYPDMQIGNDDRIEGHAFWCGFGL